MTDPDVEALEHRVREAVASAVAGSDWAPPSGAVLLDCVVIMGWFHADGTHGTSRLVCGSPWAGRGLVDMAAQAIEASYDDEIRGYGDEDEC